MAEIVLKSKRIKKEDATLDDIYGHALFLVSSRAVSDPHEAAETSLKKLENPNIYKEITVFDADRENLIKSIEIYVKRTLFPNKQ